MAITLRPMSEEIFSTYLREHEEEYARDRMITDGESFEEALKTTRAQHEALLPGGLGTPGHYFFIVNDGNDRHVGYVWFFIASVKRELFLYHIFISQAERRKGYGRLVLSEIERKARESGCRVIWLNVMGHNRAARDFYAACGYSEAAVHMNKFVD